MQNDINSVIGEVGKTVRHKRYTMSVGTIYGTPTGVTNTVDEDLIVRWCRVDKNLKVLESGNYDVGDVIMVCHNTDNVITDDQIYEDYVSSSIYGNRYKAIRVESSNVGGVQVFKRVVLKRVI